jgi:hypothetical protein
LKSTRVDNNVVNSLPSEPLQIYSTSLSNHKKFLSRIKFNALINKSSSLLRRAGFRSTHNRVELVPSPSLQAAEFIDHEWDELHRAERKLQPVACKAWHNSTFYTLFTIYSDCSIRETEGLVTTDM